MSSIDDLLKEIDCLDLNEIKKRTQKLPRPLQYNLDKERHNLDLGRNILKLDALYGSSSINKLIVEATYTWYSNFQNQYLLEILIKMKNFFNQFYTSVSEKIIKKIIKITGHNRLTSHEPPRYDDFKYVKKELEQIYDIAETCASYKFINEKENVELVDFLFKHGNIYLERFKKRNFNSINDFYELCFINLPSNYRAICKLGEGAVSKVYLVHNTAYDSDVAIKIMKPEVSSKYAASVALKEIVKLRRLQNKNIVLYYDPFEHNHQLIIPMEPFEKTLEQRMKESNGRLSPGETMSYASQISEALSECHSAGIVHHDFAPCNVGIDKGIVKLSDFNLSLYEINKLKQGALDYSSPRMLENPNKIITPEDNIWSLGVMTYEMLTGVKLFSPLNSDKMTRQQRRELILAKQRELIQSGMIYKLINDLKPDPTPEELKRADYLSDEQYLTHLKNGIQAAFQYYMEEKKHHDLIGPNPVFIAKMLKKSWNF